MKRIAIILSIVAFASCGKILDGISPKGAISTTAVGEGDIAKLTNGVLYTMEGLVSGTWWDGDELGGNFGKGPGNNTLSEDYALMTPSTGNVLSRWQKCLTSLRQVNELIASASGYDSSTARNALKTCYFCRGYIYFQMAIRWGKAPILRSVTNDEVALSGLDELWAFILEDLGKALEYPATGSGFYYVSDDAINFLLSQVYLWKGDKEAALSTAKPLLAKYALTSDAESLAKTWVYGTVSPEIVFALANKRISSQISLYSTGNEVGKSTWNRCMREPLRTTLYADESGKREGDIRLHVNLSSSTENLAAERFIKFPNGADPAEGVQFVANEMPDQSPIVVMRIAEMYLLVAEAAGATSEGISAMKTFLESRYDTVNMAASYGEEEWQDLVLDETRREFFAEGKWWFAVKRTGRTDKFDPEVFRDRKYLLMWPVPQNEIDIVVDKSKYPQNPGYTDTNE